MDVRKRLLILALGFGLMGIGAYQINHQKSKHYQEKRRHCPRSAGFHSAHYSILDKTDFPESAYQTMFSRTFGVQDGQSLQVDIPIGDVRIETSERNKAHIEFKMASHDSRKAKAFFDRLMFNVTQEGSLVRVFSQKDRHWSTWEDDPSGNANIRVILRIPKSFNVHIRTGIGDISTQALVGEVRLSSDAGDISTESISGNTIEIQTEAGDISTGNLTGNVRIDTNAGDINLGVVKAFHRLDIHSAAGSIEADQLHANQISIRSEAGDIAVREVKGTTEIKTQAGNISIQHMFGKLEAISEAGDVEVRLHECSGASLDTETGDIEISVPESFGAILDLKGSEVEVSSEIATQQNDTGTIRTELNGGGPLIEARTGVGSISLTAFDH
ncbi:MAG TPA: DUF4097 family beta strand repeat-containing protein [Rhodothermales bacterium]|nr:DUF4097 family beta strand repeat-containing protein [Rhodothermales bacterium]